MTSTEFARLVASRTAIANGRMRARIEEANLRARNRLAALKAMRVAEYEWPVSQGVALWHFGRIMRAVDLHPPTKVLFPTMTPLFEKLTLERIA